MWRLIRKNRIRSSALLFFAVLVVGGVFFLLGRALDSGLGWPAAGFACAVWGIWSLLVYFIGAGIFTGLARARKADKADLPVLFNCVEEMAIAASLAESPAIYVSQNPAPYAFACGASLRNRALVFSRGLLNLLSRDELQAVAAHEIAHLINGDSLFVGFAAALLGLPALVFDTCKIRDASAKHRMIRLVLLPLGLLFAVLAPFFSRFFYFALSRARESLADATAVRLTRFPSALAMALKKIAAYKGASGRESRILAPMFTVNPLELSRVPVFSFLRTHPPVDQRIRELSALSTGADVRDFKKKAEQLLKGETDLKEKNNKDIRSAPAGDIRVYIRKKRGWEQFKCQCGASIQLSPFSLTGNLRCRKCGKTIKIV